jgi:hypothetical protein
MQSHHQLTCNHCKSAIGKQGQSAAYSYIQDDGKGVWLCEKHMDLLDHGWKHKVDKSIFDARLEEKHRKIESLKERDKLIPYNSLADM